MNCDQYKEAIAADPSFDGGVGHLSECAACQAYRAEMQELDRTINRALLLDVPELKMPELPEWVADETPESSTSTVESSTSKSESSTSKSESSTSTAESSTSKSESSTSTAESSTSKSDNVITLRKRSWASPAWFAMAATVAVAAVLGVRLIGTGIEYESLADEVLAHVDHEPYALRVTDEAISDERLASVIPANVAHMDHSAGLITYAQSCVINGHEVPHLVIQGERGPVTILLMPEEMISEAQNLAGENVNGVILPVGNGSIAIIGEKDEGLERIREQVLKSATWST